MKLIKRLLKNKMNCKNISLYDVQKMKFILRF